MASHPIPPPPPPPLGSVLDFIGTDIMGVAVSYEFACYIIADKDNTTGQSLIRFLINITQ